MSISISSVHARQILDSRGNPTVEAEVTLSDGSFGRAAVPSGASTGSREAIELRDGAKFYEGKGVITAVVNLNTTIARALRHQNPYDQKGLDILLCKLDGTDNKSNLGANAILAASLAIAKAAAASKKLPLYRYVATLAGTSHEMSLPLPMMNVMNGGQHAAGSTDVQEYMIIPTGAKTFAEALEMGTHVFHSLSKVLRSAGYQTTVGDEGGYAPRVKNGNREPLQHIMDAIQTAGLRPGKDISLALDVAASEFFKDGVYSLSSEGRQVSAEELTDWYASLADKFPIVSVEDGLDESDWPHWIKLNTKLGKKLQLVGDDLLVTNTAILENAIHVNAANAILIKPNQIGTLSETIQAVLMAKKAGWNTIMSHRSGETEDTTIAHLAVGLGTGQIKTGSLSRSERICKYNELLRIAEAEPDLKLASPFGKT